ncbi:MAG: hypothetical protein M3P26_12120 [Gemmatimonadota bacterium]|nr:hypothetical protein [Gemmatimonadota bacterium]
MNIGEVRVFTPNNLDGGLRLPEGSSAGEYIIVVANTSSQHDVAADYVVEADALRSGTLGISTASDLKSQLTSLVTHANVAQIRQEALDNKVRAFERSGLTLRSPSGPFDASRFSVRRSAQVEATPVPNVGDIINLNVPDASTSNLCNNFFKTQATVASVSRRAILAVDTLDGPPQLLFTQAVLDSITQEFDNITYPTDSSYYNNPTDIDSNGHIILLFTGQINKLTPAGQQSFIGGFFFAGDFFPTTGTQPGTFCPESNGAEIFYLLAPDPTGRFGNVRPTSTVRQGTRGTIAHELQHMINAGNRYQNSAVSSFESTWLDEALGHFAEDAVGRVQRGFTDLQTLAYNDILPCNTPCSQANDFNAFFYQNLARLTYWMILPNASSPMSTLADTSLATRGAAWAILRYSADNLSGGDPRGLTRRLAAGPDTGVANLTRATNSPVDTIVAGWLVSMYADHTGIAGLDPKYQYRSYNFRSVMPPVARALLQTQTATYPLRVVSIGTGDTITSTNRSGTGSYYKLSVVASDGAKSVKIVSPTPNNVLNCCIQIDKEWRRRLAYPGAHIYVLRVQ